MPCLPLDIPTVVAEAFRRQRESHAAGRDAGTATTRSELSSQREIAMNHAQANPGRAPYHAHIYYDSTTRSNAEKARRELCAALAEGGTPRLCFVGALKDAPAGPHPLPQFEIHFFREALGEVRAFIAERGFTALIHPLTDDDLADHTTLAEWMGEPLPLDVTTLDPPGRNQGVPRFGIADF